MPRTFAQLRWVALTLFQAPRLRFFSKPPALMDSTRSLDPSVDLDRLVCLKGIVVRTSEVLPEMTMAAFRCQGACISKETTSPMLW